jgi:Family of unknown function (DUF5832)
MDSFKPTDPKASPLTDKELTCAVKDLTGKLIYPKINRRLVDPVVAGEPRFALFSFIKAKDAVADSDGFFGVAKLRGAFYSIEDAEARSEKIIRDVDSTNSVYICMMGEPIPLVVKGGASQLSEIDLQNKTEKAISDNVKAKRLQEKKEMDEIKQRQEALMRNEDLDEEIPEEKYVEKRVKMAHLRYAINEHIEKLKECRVLEKNVRDILRREALAHPEYETGYMERYKQGRRKAQIPEETDLTGFLKYMADPIDPPEQDNVSYIS